MFPMAFPTGLLHPSIFRSIGFCVGLLLIVIGLTGSLLVFEQDFDHFMISQQYGHITPQQVQLSPESVVNTIEAKYPAR
ncbi:MAG: PepSY domain-containing protein, partial [Nostoc sp.]